MPFPSDFAGMRIRVRFLRGALVRKPMDSRLRGNDINCILAVIPAEAGLMPSTPTRLSLLTVIPAKAGIHTACPNTNARMRQLLTGACSPEQLRRRFCVPIICPI